MGYRHEHEHPDELLRKFDVRNGAAMRLTFACFYLHGHDQHYHDHIGWPRPSRPDEICQMDPFEKAAPWLPKQKRYRLEELDPIHLDDEGYDILTLVFDDEEEIGEYIDSYLSYDAETDNQIKCTIHVNLPAFKGVPKDYGFTLFAMKTDDATVCDAVCHAMIRVLPGAPHAREGN